MLSIFLKPSLMAPVHCYLQGGGGGAVFWQALKTDIFEHIFFLIALRLDQNWNRM